LSFIPDVWHTAAYEHTVTVRKIGLFGHRQMLTCTCGMSSLIGEGHLYELHRTAEEEYKAWLAMVVRRRTRKSGSYWE
jgi:hypothetical protein